MAKTDSAIIEKELQTIAGIIAAGPSQGLPASAIENEFATKRGLDIAARTLRYRLKELVRRGQIVSLGQGRATTYVLAGEATAPNAESGTLAVSRAAEKLRTLVRRPLHLRTPVGYDAAWIRAYNPGTTTYLSPTIRKHLHELGATPDREKPAGTFARDILSRLLIDLAWASSRLEGNTYSRLDTQNLIEFGQHAEGKDLLEAQMILNHKAAIEQLVGAVEDGVPTRQTILMLHAALAENLVGDPAGEGRLRTRPVSVAGTTYTPTAIPQLIQECFDGFVQRFDAIPDPFEQSFFAMVHIPYLQPFIDVNKRTSRLVSNIPLIRANLCPLSFVDLPEREYIEATLAVYEEKRIELLRDVYVWAYERSRAQYIVVRDSLPKPDALRLRYRAQLSEAVAEAVTTKASADVGRLRAWAASHGIPESVQDAFAQMARELLLALNEGSIARYRVTPADYRAWKELNAQAAR